MKKRGTIKIVDKTVDRSSKNIKAQITLFIIIFLVIIIVSTGIFFLTYNTSTSTRTQAVKKVSTADVDTQSILKYTETCMEQALEDALIDIGQQGGYLFPGQPGALYDSLLPFQKKILINDSEKDATFILIKDDRQPPWWPCYTQSLTNPLNCRFEKNSQLIKTYIYGKTKALPLNDAGTGFSISQELDKLMIDKLADCTDFTFLTTLPQYSKFNITTGEAFAKTLIADNKITAKVNFPIFIKSDNDVSKQAIDFTINLKHDFKGLYEALKQIISADNQYLDFDIEKDTKEGIYRDYDGSVKDLLIKERPAKVEVIRKQNYDIIKIIDSSIKINGKPYEFIFGRENHNPILDLIDQLPNEEDAEMLTGGSSPLTVEFKPKVYDVDEDDINSYDFSKIEYKYDCIPNVTLFSSNNIISSQIINSQREPSLKNNFNFIVISDNSAAKINRDDIFRSSNKANSITTLAIEDLDSPDNTSDNNPSAPSVTDVQTNISNNYDVIKKSDSFRLSATVMDETSSNIKLKVTAYRGTISKTMKPLSSESNVFFVDAKPTDFGCNEETINPETNCEIFIKAVDETGNINSDESIELVIDSVNPEVILISPQNNGFSTDQLIQLKYKFIDKSLADYATCVLYLDDIGVKNSLEKGNEELSFFVQNPGTNAFSWRVGCEDLAGNKGIAYPPRTVVLTREFADASGGSSASGQEQDSCGSWSFDGNSARLTITTEVRPLIYKINLIAKDTEGLSDSQIVRLVVKS